jgi:hypothetical protein
MEMPVRFQSGWFSFNTTRTSYQNACSRIAYKLFRFLDLGKFEINQRFFGSLFVFCVN